ncbi:hypothetical protein BJ138DRAFT_1085723 [Hygrophoropsis aurantiaca]|uniref:Uncharacterized protein n=1 Tax=Hygrophoropsis aurantiaca TaxID=72124 RepID=A0ACB8AEX3_9AGAM|nr:hypothetical protein BJ138DRAFT_1085723 [Hygrophoropsis aurantiaca]
MPFKRSASPTYSDSGSSRERSPKRPRPSSPWNIQEKPLEQIPLNIYILSTKLEPRSFSELVNLVEGKKDSVKPEGQNEVPPNKLDGIQLKLELAKNADEADIIVTAVRMRQRLERHVKWDLAKTKAIVTPEWLRDSVQSGTPMPCGDYAALRDLHDETVEHCPDKSERNDSDPPNTRSSEMPSISSEPSNPAGSPYPTDLKHLTYTSRYCCARASPLVSQNQDLVNKLDIIRRCRHLEGEERSMLSYSRAIAVIKAYPRVIDLANLKGEVAKLPYIGDKLFSMIEEYIKTGEISKSREIAETSRFRSLSAFTTIHGIGPHTARQLYALGLRTLEELERYYEVLPGVTDEETLHNLDADRKTNNDAAVEQTIKIGLALRHDLTQTIPRDEVEEIQRVIMQHLDVVQKGCRSIIVGGYRRGKPQSNDVDIVFTHNDWTLGSQKVKGLCKRLVHRLHEQELVTHVMHLSGFHEHNALRTHHWDSLEKALTVFVLPANSSGKRVYRRVDLIFAAPEVFWTAVVGWSGSTMFQRDLRLWAKQQKGMKFDSSGISRRHDSKLYFPKSEREVFEHLGLTYVHPTLRNADA